MLKIPIYLRWFGKIGMLWKIYAFINLASINRRKPGLTNTISLYINLVCIFVTIHIISLSWKRYCSGRFTVFLFPFFIAFFYEKKVIQKSMFNYCPARSITYIRFQCDDHASPFISQIHQHKVLYLNGRK